MKEDNIIDNTTEHIIIPLIEEKNDRIFVVTAYRWGGRNKHSYVVGVYESVDAALASATHEEYFRSDKYVCEVVEMRMNGSIWEKGCITIKRPTNEYNSGEVC